MGNRSDMALLAFLTLCPLVGHEKDGHIHVATLALGRCS